MSRFNIPQKKDFLCVGVITQPHGLSGEVVLKPLLDNIDLLKKGVVLKSIDDEEFKIEAIRSSNKGLLTKFANIKNRNEAENSRKIYLYVSCDELPAESEEEIYYYDLVTYKLIDDANNILGEVAKVFDAGANTILDVKLSILKEEDGKIKKNILIPYTHDVILDVNKKEKTLLVDKELFEMYCNICNT
ncbi:MAG: 16S rRNA processing protein RimM [Proteobacteria bacterium]|nr:16S rRNA processing protein RimM [Pseudomonadota bacterium]